MLTVGPKNDTVLLAYIFRRQGMGEMAHGVTSLVFI